MPKQEVIDCRTAQNLMDRRDWREGDNNEQLQAHFEVCPECCAESLVEEPLRTIISPEALPAPAMGFEQVLRAKLGLVAKIKPDPFAEWGWLIALVTIAAVATPLIFQAWGTILEYAGIAQTTVGLLLRPLLEAIGRPALERGGTIFNQLGGTMALNLALAAIIGFGGYAAVRLSARR